MKQRVFVVHGWAATPDMEWFPWLKNELERRGVEVFIPMMPDTYCPVIDAWVDTLRDTVGTLRETDMFVGHSIGCQTIMRYLERETGDAIKGFICVAGWFTLRNLENEVEELIAKSWVEAPIDFDAVRRIAGPITAIFSDTDPYVELSHNRDIFEHQLGARIIIEHDKGHFSEDNDIYELPVVRDCIFELLNQ